MGKDATTALSARFEIRAALGRTVSLAWDTQLRRSVVLKRLPASEGSERITTLLGAPPHPNLALLRHDFYDGDDRVLVMDLVEGTSLADIGDAAADEVRAWLSQIGYALNHLHTLDPAIAHGDVKAANVIVSGARAVLVDLGAEQVAPDDDTTALTKVANALGAGHHGRARLRIGAVAAGLLLVAGAGGLVRGEAPRPALASERVTRSLPGHIVSATAAAAAPVSLEVETSVPSAAVPRLAAVLPPAPARVVPSRLGVYTASEWLGQLDVFHLNRGPMPVLQKRNQELLVLWSNIATLKEGWLLFYRAADGRLETAPVERDGRLGFGDQKMTPEMGWTHVVGAGDEVAWLYRSDTGRARAIRYRDGFPADDDTHSGELRGGYDHVVGLGGDRVLHYESKTGRGVIVAIGGDGGVRASTDVVLPKGWTAVAMTGRGYVIGVTSTGHADVVRLVGSGADVVGTLELGGLGWTNAVGFDRGLIVYSVTGAALIAEIDQAGSATRVTPWSVVPTARLVTVN